MTSPLHRFAYLQRPMYDPSGAVADSGVTRMFFSQVAAAVTPSSWSAGWDSTAGAFSVSMGEPFSGNGGGNVFTVATNGTGVSGQKRAMIRSVSPPLAAGVISGNIIGVIGAYETNLADNYSVAIAIKVIKSDGSDRGIMLSVNTDASNIECIAGSSNGGQSRQFVSTAISTITVSDDDRIVCEVGLYQQSTAVASGGITIVDADRTSSSGYMTDMVWDGAQTANIGIPWLEFDCGIRFKQPYFVPTLAEVPNSGDSSSQSNATTTLTFAILVTLGAHRKGDLITVLLESKASATWSNTTDGGQTWTAETAFSGSSSTAPFCRAFWCTFNGTWSASPVFTSTSGTGTSGVMVAHRGPTINTVWAQDVAQAAGTFTAGSTPFTKTITGITTVHNNAVCVAAWFSNDDNTWSLTTSGSWGGMYWPQFRNVASTDMSMTLAHLTMPTAGATGDVSKNQATLGGDAGCTFIMAWYPT